MSVLIKGMEMPENCDDCPMLYEYRFCALTDDYAKSIGWKTEEKRMPNCPLIELPDHGDLIDKDELSRLVDESFEHFLSRLDLKCPKVIIPAERSE